MESKSAGTARRPGPGTLVVLSPSSERPGLPADPPLFKLIMNIKPGRPRRPPGGGGGLLETDRKLSSAGVSERRPPSPSTDVEIENGRTHDEERPLSSLYAFGLEMDGTTPDKLTKSENLSDSSLSLEFLKPVQ